MSTSEKDKKKKEAAVAAFVDKTEIPNGSTHSSVFGRRMVNMNAEFPSSDQEAVSPVKNGESESHEVSDEESIHHVSEQSESDSDNNPEKGMSQSSKDQQKNDGESMPSESVEDEGVDDRMLVEDDDSNSRDASEENEENNPDGQQQEGADEDNEIVEDPKKEKQDKRGKWHKDENFKNRFKSKYNYADEEYLRQREQEELDYYNRDQAQSQQEEEYFSDDRTYQNEETSVYHHDGTQYTQESPYVNPQPGKNISESSSQTSYANTENYLTHDRSAQSIEDDRYLHQDSFDIRNSDSSTDMASTAVLPPEEQTTGEEILHSKAEAENRYLESQRGPRQESSYISTDAHQVEDTPYLQKDTPGVRTSVDESQFSEEDAFYENRNQESAATSVHRPSDASNHVSHSGEASSAAQVTSQDSNEPVLHNVQTRPRADEFFSRETIPQHDEENSYLTQEGEPEAEGTYLHQETTAHHSGTYLESSKTPEISNTYIPLDQHAIQDTPYLHNETEQSGSVFQNPQEPSQANDQFPKNALRHSSNVMQNGSPTVVSQAENLRHPDGYADQEAFGTQTAGIVRQDEGFADQAPTSGGVSAVYNAGNGIVGSAEGYAAGMPSGTDLTATEGYFLSKGIDLGSMDDNAVQRAADRGSINGRALSKKEQGAVRNYLNTRKTQTFLDREHQISGINTPSDGTVNGVLIGRNASVISKDANRNNVVLHSNASVIPNAKNHGPAMPGQSSQNGLGGKPISRNATVFTPNGEGQASAATKGMTASEILQYRKTQNALRKGPWVAPGKGSVSGSHYLAPGVTQKDGPYLGESNDRITVENSPYLSGKTLENSPLSTMTAAQRLLYLQTKGKVTSGNNGPVTVQAGKMFPDVPAYITTDSDTRQSSQILRGPSTLGNIRNKVYISHGQITGIDQLDGKAKMVHPEDGKLTGKASHDPLSGKAAAKGAGPEDALTSGKVIIGKIQNSAMDKLSGSDGLGISAMHKMNAANASSRQKISFQRTIGRPQQQGPTGKMNDPATISALWKRNQRNIFQRTLLKKQSVGRSPLGSIFSIMPQKGIGKGTGSGIGGGSGVGDVLKIGVIFALIMAFLGQITGGAITTISALTPRAAMVDMNGNELDHYGEYPGTDYNASTAAGGSENGSATDGVTVSDVADPTPNGNGTYKYGDYTITEQDIRLLTAVVCHEEGWDLATHDERVGIAAIILHRLVRNEEGWPNTILGVINQPGQFYPLTVEEANSYSTNSQFSKNYADCRRAAIEAVCGADPTGGAVGEMASSVDPTKYISQPIWQKQIGRTIFFGWGNTPSVSTSTMVGGGNFNGGTKSITQHAVNAMLNVEYEAMLKAQEENRTYQLVSNNKNTAFENLSIYRVSCNGTSLPTNTVTTRNYTAYTTDYTYYGQPLKKGTGNNKITHIRKPKIKHLKDSDKTGDTLAITYHGTNTTITHTYYSGSKTTQYFGDCDGLEDSLDVDSKSLLGWAFQENADGTEADDSIIAFDRYEKISGDTISMLADQYSGQLDLYAVYASANAKVKHDNIGVFTNDDIKNGADEYLNGDKPITIRYAYRDQNGNMTYSDKNSDVRSSARAQIYKNILSMATIVTGNQTKHPERYVRYCEERMRDAINGYAGVSIDYTPVKLSGGTNDKKFRYTWYDGFTKYVAPGARLKVTATIYVTQNLKAMCEHDPTNESYFDDNPDFFQFPGWTNSNIGQAEVYAQLEDQDFCTVFNVIIPEIDPTMLSGSGDGSDIVAAAMEEYNSYHGQTGGMKYISWFGGFGPGTAWCNIFVSYVANKCGYIKSGIIPKSAGCANTYAWFEKKGLTHRSGTYTPKAGDLIFFGPNASEHIGIVEKCENGVVYTIEGNYSDTIGRGSYPLSRSSIWGYASPQYPSSVTSGDGSESYVYKALKKQGLNDAAIAGIMGNMQSEGGVTGWHNAENSSYATDAADRQYTANVDNGSISRHDFSFDGVGYGPVQLTYYSYKQTLYDNAKAAGKSIGDPGIMMSTIIQLYKGHFAQMNAAGSPEAAAAYWLNNVERPLSPDPSVRGAQARTYYNKILSGAYK